MENVDMGEEGEGDFEGGQAIVEGGAVGRLPETANGGVFGLGEEAGGGGEFVGEGSAMEFISQGESGMGGEIGGLQSRLDDAIPFCFGAICGTFGAGPDPDGWSTEGGGGFHNLFGARAFGAAQPEVGAVCGNNQAGLAGLLSDFTGSR